MCDALEISSEGASSFGKDADQFSIVQVCQSFIHAVVDFDCLKPVSEQETVPVFEQPANPKKVHGSISFGCNERKEYGTIDITCMICYENDGSFCWHVPDALDIFDEQFEHWRNQVFDDRKDHTITSFTLFVIVSIFKCLVTKSLNTLFFSTSA